MQEEINQLRKELEELKSMFYKDNFSTSQTFKKDIKIDGKFAVNGNTPVGKAAAIIPPSGGTTIDNEARTAIGLLITAIKNPGITL